MKSVLLLNASLQPLAVITQKHMVVLLSKEKITFLDEETKKSVWESFQNRRFDEKVVVARLLNNIYIPRIVLKPNRRNLFLRDNAMCQYCKVKVHDSEMTIDHIVPISRGGATGGWLNRVVACKKCNWKKANNTPEEVGLRLIKKPGPLTREYAHMLFMRYPEMKPIYDNLLGVKV